MRSEFSIVSFWLKCTQTFSTTDSTHKKPGSIADGTQEAKQMMLETWSKFRVKTLTLVSFWSRRGIKWRISHDEWVWDVRLLSLMYCLTNSLKLHQREAFQMPKNKIKIMSFLSNVMRYWHDTIACHPIKRVLLIYLLQTDFRRIMFIHLWSVVGLHKFIIWHENH